MIREREYGFEVQKVKHQMALAAGKSVADVLITSLMEQQQHPQVVVGLVPGERVSEGVRAVLSQALQDRFQRHIDEQDLEEVAADLSQGAVVEPSHIQQVVQAFGDEKIALVSLLLAHGELYIADRILLNDRAGELMAFHSPLAGDPPES